MAKLRPLVALLLLALASVSLCQAHEMKVLASRLVLTKPGDRTTVYLSWGHALPVDDLTDSKALERYEHLTPSGKVGGLKFEGVSMQANVIELKEEGVHQMIAARKPGLYTFVFDAEGNRVFKRGPKSAVKEGTIDYGMREQQFAKALIVVGKPKTEAVKSADLPIEIVPVEGPAAWRGGQMVRFRVLCEGKLLAHEQVRATYVGFRPDTAWCFASDTDEEGIVSVRVKEPGTWVLRAERRKLAAGKDRDEYDYDILTATLTLEVRP